MPGTTTNSNNIADLEELNLLRVRLRVRRQEGREWWNQIRPEIVFAANYIEEVEDAGPTQSATSLPVPPIDLERLNRLGEQLRVQRQKERERWAQRPRITDMIASPAGAASMRVGPRTPTKDSPQTSDHAAEPPEVIENSHSSGVFEGQAHQHLPF